MDAAIVQARNDVEASRQRHSRVGIVKRTRLPIEQELLILRIKAERIWCQRTGIKNYRRAASRRRPRTSWIRNGLNAGQAVGVNHWRRGVRSGTGQLPGQRNARAFDESTGIAGCCRAACWLQGRLEASEIVVRDGIIVGPGLRVTRNIHAGDREGVHARNGLYEGGLCRAKTTGYA